MPDNERGNKRIYLSSPTMHGEEQRFVAEAFDTNWVAPLGPNVNSFETEMASYTGCGYAAALSSGTAAIHLGLKLLGVKRDDIVFVSDLTFSASCNPIVYEGAIPVFIDSEPDTWNMSPEALARAFEKHQIDLSRSGIGNHLVESGSVEGRTRNAVITVCRIEVPALLLHIAAEHDFLILDGHRLACSLVVAAEPAIDSNIVVFMHLDYFTSLDAGT